MQPPDERFAEAEQTADDLKSKTEAFAREEPIQAVGLAFAAGLVLTLLPVGAIIAGILRLGLALVKPALVILGAVKAYEEINKRQQG